MKLEIWADSFHEGDWCCQQIAQALVNSFGFDKPSISYNMGFQPVYSFRKGDVSFSLTVYGSYKSWDDIPRKISEILSWGKPDFILYDPEKDAVIFAVEETAATATGNQCMQRLERQYGSARFHIPYWYLVSEYGLHHDGGTRRDSIWPVVAATKLTIQKKAPSVVVHYSDQDNLEDYSSGKGLNCQSPCRTQLPTAVLPYCVPSPLENAYRLDCQNDSRLYQWILHGHDPLAI